MTNVERVVLIGFSGSGKSTTGRLLSDMLGWRLIDTDADIEQELQLTVPEVFSVHGEAFFRSAERTALLQGLALDHAVIATGGGAVVDSELWATDLLRSPGTLTVTLEASPETVLARLRAHQAAEGSAVVRPMIAGDDPLSRIIELKNRRQEVYDRSNLSLIVDNVNAETVAREIASLVASDISLTRPTIRLNASSGSSDVLIKPGIATMAGEIARQRWPRARKAWVISDETVGSFHGPAITAAFDQSGFVTSLKSVPSGESSKSWVVAGQVLDHLLDGGIERGDLVVALGGGVIGDLAGFVAATVLRGVPLMQMPTSLLAMVDSSIGGKTGINHRAGKNLIGAFYQPPVVLIEPRFLSTLPPRELTAGWAEVLKHGVIQASTPGGERADLTPFYQRNAARLQALQEAAITYAIRRNVALKAAVVEADEKETGIRAYLNFGHTIGHGIEAAGYRLLHGEAVAVGMRGAMKIGQRLEMIDDTSVSRLDALLEDFALPRSTDADPAQVLQKMGSDKKRVAGKQRWVLPLATGGVTIRDDVPTEIVQAVLADICA